MNPNKIHPEGTVADLSSVLQEINKGKRNINVKSILFFR